MNNEAIKPSRWYYLLSVVVLFGGWTILAVFILSRISGLTDNLTQVVVPGSKQLQLSETGSYTIFYEFESVVNGKV